MRLRHLLEASFCVSGLSSNPEGSDSLKRVYQVKTPVIRLRLLLGDLTSISLEHLFDDLFKLKDRFKALGMEIKDGKVYLPDLEIDHV
jgi:hypothetical protein